jgi:ribosomal-protein-alanine N-acetyltransferase
MRIPLGQEDYVVRSYEPGDVAALVKYADNEAIARQLLDHFPHPYTEETAREWLQAAGEQDPEVSFAIASSEELVGSIGLLLREDVFRRTAEVGYWLAEPFWGRGIVTRALQVFTRWAFREFDFARIEARVYEINPASRRVLEKAGFHLEGRLRHAATKNDQLMDLYIYALLADEAEGDEEWNG